MSRLSDLQAELKKLMATQEYAYAMGHGCTIGHHPIFTVVRDRAAELQCQIADEKWLNEFGITELGPSIGL